MRLAALTWFDYLVINHLQINIRRKYLTKEIIDNAAKITPASSASLAILVGSPSVLKFQQRIKYGASFNSFQGKLAVHLNGP